MEKNIWLFGRKEGSSRAQFGRHYIDVHAPLGARLVRSLKGYIVNLVEGDLGPDAVTEHWLESAADLIDIGKSFDSPADAQKVHDDDASFMGSHQCLVVREEIVHMTADAPLVTAVQSREGAKMIWLLRGTELPPLPTGAWQVVDNRVDSTLRRQQGGDWQEVPADIAFVRMVWMPSIEAAAGAGGGALIAREFPFIAPIERADRQ